MSIRALDAASGEYEWGPVLDGKKTAGTPVVVDGTVSMATDDRTEAEYVDATLHALERSADWLDAAPRPGSDACCESTNLRLECAVPAG